MDFEWHTRAPGDVTSPFYQLGVQHENKKRECFTARLNLGLDDSDTAMLTSQSLPRHA